MGFKGVSLMLPAKEIIRIIIAFFIFLTCWILFVLFLNIYPSHKPKEIKDIIINDPYLIIEGDFKTNEILHVEIVKKNTSSQSCEIVTLTKQRCTVQLPADWFDGTIDNYELLINLSYGWHHKCELIVKHKDNQYNTTIIKQKMHKLL